jgi:glyoxylase-like metal-dependent hydrolase (beta-lactamase superfamily II)
MIHTLDLRFKGLPDTIAAFLIETSDGPALVETGPHSTFPSLTDNLARYGYRPEDVRHVFISHIHLDHAGAAWALARLGAKIYLHPAGERHVVNPEKLLQSAKMIYKDQMDALWGDLQPIDPQSLVIAAHGDVFTVEDTNFTAWHTPGHAVHHIAWQVGDSLFTGDVGGVKIHRGPVVPPCPPPDINVEQWQESIALIRGLPVERLYLTHYGEITHIGEHLDVLEQTLLDWANWMRPYFEAGESHEIITPLFAEYVHNQLKKYNLNAEEIEIYENANPAWMSVAGLMRYWKKREGGVGGFG